MTLPRIAVTMGDPAGIGPEICLDLLRYPVIRQQCIPIIFGDAHVLYHAAEICRLPRPRSVIPYDEWEKNCASIEDPVVVDINGIGEGCYTPGVVNDATGRAGYLYVEKAISAAMAGEVAAVTTGPINKEALRDAGIEFPGHTEILAAKTKSDRTCMMLTSPDMTCSFVTSHIGFGEVLDYLSTERIRDVIDLTAEAMRKIRGRNPSIIVCGLNPHAGEHGLFGNGEEEKIILPAIKSAIADHLHVEGPLPPDSAFLSRRRQQTDAYICMYHDQGHIPLKALAFDEAVNITLGLPITRTSVDHGTALDIAWKGTANPNSLFRATELAARLVSND